MIALTIASMSEAVSVAAVSFFGMEGVALMSLITTKNSSSVRAKADAVSSIRTYSDSMLSVVATVASYPSSVVISAIASSPVVVSAVASATEEAVSVVAQASLTSVKASKDALSVDSRESRASAVDGRILRSSSVTINALRVTNFSLVLRERSVSIFVDWLASSLIRSDVVGAVRFRRHSFACFVTICVLAFRSMSVLLLLEESVVAIMSMETTKAFM